MFCRLEYLDGDISNGLLGYISALSFLLHEWACTNFHALALGVDSTASYSINNGNSL